MTLPPKHKRQVKDSILSLQSNPMPHDAKKLQGYEKYIRIDIGEYRIIYSHDTSEDVITISIVGRRNDDSIYKIAKRALK
jgi:mRNA interferase RelE/StbE